jgi:hypothetical protein
LYINAIPDPGFIEAGKEVPAKQGAWDEEKGSRRERRAKRRQARSSTGQQKPGPAAEGNQRRMSGAQNGLRMEAEPPGPMGTGLTPRLWLSGSLISFNSPIRGASPFLLRLNRVRRLKETNGGCPGHRTARGWRRSHQLAAQPAPQPPARKEFRSLVAPPPSSSRSVPRTSAVGFPDRGVEGDQRAGQPKPRSKPGPHWTSTGKATNYFDPE